MEALGASTASPTALEQRGRTCGACTKGLHPVREVGNLTLKNLGLGSSVGGYLSQVIDLLTQFSVVCYKLLDGHYSLTFR